MRASGFFLRIQQTLDSIRSEGLWKSERELESAQGPLITVNGKQVLNFCSNNYLGLANDSEITSVAAKALNTWGYGLSSVRFICGTQTIHKELEQEVARFFEKDDAILYSSCFDANGGVFETLLGEHDVILSDTLNHASIIDGTRLSKATVQRYQHNDLEDLKKQLQACKGFKTRLIVTDGVFSMDGHIAHLQEICDLAERYDALVMVDDSHGTGVLGKSGRGSPEATNTLNRIDIITSTFGKALGGASGGFLVGQQSVVDLLRQRSRPYLFSNSLPPMVVATSLWILRHFNQYDERRKRLQALATQFRTEMEKNHFTLIPGSHAIVPVMFHDATVAKQMADGLLKHGVYAIGFWYPVVPKGQARIRIQLSAAHTATQVDHALQAFAEVRSSLPHQE